ncbi:MAG: hypothetical protein G01um101425_603 [Candidatus Peregrinibacteria bacterium Gr01-1014_25]|nr:MAG: hypothetical protein G01um101425_603 [Candidatus Peregrinibacteria bacterium Gr01-1014_25]
MPQPVEALTRERVASAIQQGPQALRTLVRGPETERYAATLQVQRALELMRSAQTLSEQHWQQASVSIHAALNELEQEIGGKAAELGSTTPDEGRKTEIDAQLQQLRRETASVIAARKEINQMVLDRNKVQHDQYRTGGPSKEPWGMKEWIGVGGLSLTSLWIFNALRRPAKSVGNAVRHPFQTAGKVLVGALSLLFGAKLVERWLQKPSRQRLHDAHEGTNAFGGVAAGRVPERHNVPPTAALETPRIDTAALPAIPDGDLRALATQLVGTDLIVNRTERVDPDTKLAALTAKLDGAKEKPGTFTLVDAYRLQGLRELQIAERAEEAGTPEGRTLAKAARMRAAYCDTYADALAEYAQMWQHYEEAKALCQQDGLAPDAAVDQAAREEFLAVARAARARMQAGFGGGKGTNAAAMDSAERTLWETLKVPGDASTKALAVVQATTGLLQTRYQRMVARVNNEVPPELRNNHVALQYMNGVVADYLAEKGYKDVAKKLRRSRIFLAPSEDGSDDWKSVMQEKETPDFLKFPDIRNPRLGNIDWWLARSTEQRKVKLKESALRQLFQEAFAAESAAVATTGKQYGLTPENAYQTYRDLAAPLLPEVVKDKKELIEKFENVGAEHIGFLVRLQEQMARYQAHRVTLAAVRHRGAKGPSGGAEVAPQIWMQNPDVLAQAYDQFFLAQQRDGTARMQGHLAFVDQKLLPKDWRSQLEHQWNHNARNFIAWTADAIVSVETLIVPTPYLTRKASEALIGEFYELIGWPKYENGERKGQWKDRKDLTPAEKEAFDKKQKSVLDCIDTFQKDGTEKEGKSINGKSHLENMRASTELMQQMAGANAAKIQQWLSEDENLKPEDADALADVRVENIGQIEQIAQSRGVSKAVVVLRCFAQFQDDVIAYHGAYGRFLQGLHEVLGMHMRWEAAIEAFLQNQLNLGLGILTAYVGYKAAKAARRWYKNRQMKRLGRRVAALERVQVTAPTRPTVETPRTSAPSREPTKIREGGVEKPKWKERGFTLTPEAEQALAKDARATERLLKTPTKEIAMASRRANLATRVMTRVPTFALAGVGLTMDFLEYREIEKQLEHEKNPEIRSILESKKDAVKLHGGGQLLALTLGVGPGLIASGILLVGKEFADQMYEDAIKWSQEAGDFFRTMQPHEILAELGKSDMPNFATWVVTPDENMEGARRNRHGNLARAYFTHMAPLHVPMTVPLEQATPQEQKEYRERVARFVMDAMINYGTYRNIQDAMLHAECICVARLCKEKGIAMMVNARGSDGSPVPIDLTAYAIGGEKGLTQERAKKGVPSGVQNNGIYLYRRFKENEQLALIELQAGEFSSDLTPKTSKDALSLRATMTPTIYARLTEGFDTMLQETRAKLKADREDADVEIAKRLIGIGMSTLKIVEGKQKQKALLRHYSIERAEGIIARKVHGALIFQTERLIALMEMGQLTEDAYRKARGAIWEAIWLPVGVSGKSYMKLCDAGGSGTDMPLDMQEISKEAATWSPGSRYLIFRYFSGQELPSGMQESDMRWMAGTLASMVENGRCMGYPFPMVEWFERALARPEYAALHKVYDEVLDRELPFRRREKNGMHLHDVMESAIPLFGMKKIRATVLALETVNNNTPEPSAQPYRGGSGTLPGGAQGSVG